MSTPDPALIAAYDQAKAHGDEFLARLRAVIKENTAGESPASAAAIISMTLEMFPELTLRTLLQAALVKLEECDGD